MDLIKLLNISGIRDLKINIKFSAFEIYKWIYKYGVEFALIKAPNRSKLFCWKYETMNSYLNVKLYVNQHKIFNPFVADITLVYGWWFDAYQGNIPSILSSNFEAFASELIEKI